jgi:hypothetical protein
MQNVSSAAAPYKTARNIEWLPQTANYIAAKYKPALFPAPRITTDTGRVRTFFVDAAAGLVLWDYKARNFTNSTAID